MWALRGMGGGGQGTGLQRQLVAVSSNARAGDLQRQGGPSAPRHQQQQGAPACQVVRAAWLPSSSQLGGLHLRKGHTTPWLTRALCVRDALGSMHIAGPGACWRVS